MTQGATITPRRTTVKPPTRPDPTRVVVRVLLFLLPLPALGLHGVSVGFALAAIPLLLPLLYRKQVYRGERPLLVLWLVSLLSAPVLISLALQDPARGVDRTIELHLLVQLAGGALTLAALLWGRSILGLRAAAMTYAAGCLAQVMLDHTTWSTNAWKYAFAWPVAVFLLAWLRRRHVLALLALAAVSVVQDFRSFAGLCVLAAALTWWRGKPNEAKARTVRPLLKVAVLVFLVYQGGSWAATNGYLGQSIQDRTLEQAQTGESLLIGARPESAAAVQLFQSRPIGFGPGVMPDAFDVATAKTGLVSVNAATDGAYVDQYLFGARIELHSVISDLWVNFGLVGLALAAAIAWLLLSHFGRRIARGGLDALTAFAVVLGLWDLAFSPLGPNLPHVVFALALLLPPRSVADELVDRPGRLDGADTGKVGRGRGAVQLH